MVFERTFFEFFSILFYLVSCQVITTTANTENNLKQNVSLKDILDVYLAKSGDVQNKLKEKIKSMEHFLKIIQIIEESVPKFSSEMEILQQNQSEKQETSDDDVIAIMFKINEWLDFLQDTLKGKSIPNVHSMYKRGRYKRSPIQGKGKRKKGRYLGMTDYVEDYPIYDEFGNLVDVGRRPATYDFPQSNIGINPAGLGGGGNVIIQNQKRRAKRIH